MAKAKYGKYVICDTPKNPYHVDHLTSVWITNELMKKIKGTFYLEADIVTKADDERSFSRQAKAHKHDFDEYIIFLGTDPNNPGDLGGEVDIWLGDEEKHTLTKSCAVFVPKGLFHTPLEFKRLDRPMVHLRIGNTNKYDHGNLSNDPKWDNYRWGMDDGYKAKAESKYGKYIIAQEPKKSIHPNSMVILRVDEDIVEGAFYLYCEMITDKIIVPRIDGIPQAKPHNHPFDEYLVFLGTNPKDASDLGGEVEIWLDDEEKYTFTKSCAVFVPKELQHTPIEFKRVDTPIIMVRTGKTLRYSVLSLSRHPKWANVPDPPADVPFQ